MRVLGWFLVVVLGAAALLTLDPEAPGRLNPSWAGLTMVSPIAQVVMVRPLVIAALAVVGVVLLVVGTVRRFTMGAGWHALTLALVVLLVAGAHVWVLADRGVRSPEALPADDGVRAAGPGTGAITVLALNTLDGRTTPAEIAALADENGADVLVLTETRAEEAAAVAAELVDAGHAPFQVFTDSREEEGTGATALLVAQTLGEYTQTAGPQTRFGAVRAQPTSGVGPELVAVHPPPPLPGLTESWEADLATVAALCREGDTAGLVVAGDLNATVDHAPLRDLGGCRATTLEAGVGAVGTWPTTTPVWLGAPIDHVLAGEAYEVEAAAVVERGRSDHRAVLVRLLPVG